MVATATKPASPIDTSLLQDVDGLQRFSKGLPELLEISNVAPNTLQMRLGAATLGPPDHGYSIMPLDPGSLDLLHEVCKVRTEGKFI